MLIGSYHNSPGLKNNDWITPPEIIKALGPFDLDPCSPKDRPWDTAKKHYTIIDNGLWMPWENRVWLNPPYGANTARWLELMAAHGNGTVLTFARTETKMFFQYVWPLADSILFLKGRLNFYYIDGTRAPKNAGAPSVLIAYGAENTIALEASGIAGKLIRLKQPAPVRKSILGKYFRCKR